eukprot:Nitzschia sp. Nitz4//scaffold5_size260463//174332//175649//NITZ4_001000-RA/size260463-augustus-gene-0.15-mRNA-1//1//CDS//3329555394//9461//frame0
MAFGLVSSNPAPVYSALILLALASVLIPAVHSFSLVTPLLNPSIRSRNFANSVAPFSLSSKAAIMPPIPSAETAATPADNHRRRGRTSTSVMMVMDDEESAMAVTPASSTPIMEQSPLHLKPGSHQELLYTLGINLARQLSEVKSLIEDPEEMAHMVEGLADALTGRLDAMGQQKLLESRSADLDKLVATRADVVRDRLEQQGREMLAAMEGTEGAEVLEENVILHPIADGGNGRAVTATRPNTPRPTIGSTVQIHYHATLCDGTVVDASRPPTSGGESLEEVEPIKVALAQLLPGFRIGLLGMREGETAIIGVPPEAAYGSEGTPEGRVPGGSTLFFNVELVKVLTAGTMSSGFSSGLVGANGRALSSNSGSGLITSSNDMTTPDADTGVFGDDGDEMVVVEDTDPSGLIL